jgi:hypothetical protein
MRPRCSVGRAAVVLLGALAGAVVLLAVPSAPSWAGGRAALAVDPATAAPGQVLTVTGVGLPGSRDVVVTLCGDLGLEGSADCALGEATGGATSPSGDLVVQLRASLPPVPCPCVVEATVQGATVPGASTALGLVGAPSAPLRKPVTAGSSGVAISRVELRGPVGGLAAWLGLGGRALVELTVVNRGSVPVEVGRPAVRLDAGPGTPSAVGAEPIGVLAPGARRTLTVPVELPAATVGHVYGTIQVAAGGTVLRAQLSRFVLPPGALAVAGLVLLLAAGLLARRLRRARPDSRGRVDVEAVLAGVLGGWSAWSKAGPSPAQSGPNGDPGTLASGPWAR